MKLNYSFVGSVLFTFSLSICQSTFSQTGAGGVGNAGTNVIWLDANTIIQANGTQVSSFADVSGNGNNLSQGTFVKQPLFNTGVVNGLPAIQFDGVNDLLSRGATPALASTNLTYFIVFKRANLTSQMLITAGYASNSPKWRTYCNSGSNNLINAHFSPTIKHASYTDAGTPTFISTHITPTQIRVYKLGLQQALTNAAYTAPTGHQNLALGNTLVAGPNNYTLNGFVAEVVVYNSALNNLQRIIVENYLGAKYGMTIPTDLYVYQASHNIGLIALGNDGVSSQTTAKGSGVLELSAASAMTTGEYFIVAHTNDALSNFTTSDIPPSLIGYKRWTRTWKLDETGEVGNVTLKYYLAGGNNFGETTTYTLLVDNVTQNGDFSDATQVTGIYDGGSQTITFTTNINDGDFFTLSASDQTLEIHAINSGNFSNPNTWDCVCIPNGNDNVFIDANVSVTLDINAEVGYFSIGDPGGLLIMNTNNTLSIYKDWDMLGSVQLTAGKIAMVGIADQYINPGGNALDFNDFEINNSGGGTVTLYESFYSLKGTLYPIKGHLTLDSAPGNSFIFLSTASTGGARINQIASGFTFTGNYTTQRFIPPGLTNWRGLSCPVAGSTLLDWDANCAISGIGFPDGCAIGVSGCFYSVRFWKNSILNNVTSIVHPLVIGRGYEMHLGDDLNNFSGVTLSNKGQLETSASVPISMNTGWMTLGNPFLSPILFSSIAKPSQLGNYFYVYDASIGDYQWYDGISGLGSIPELNNGLMSQYQSVWVFITSACSMSIEQSNKTTTNGTYIRSSEVVQNSLTLFLKEQNSTYRSSIVLQEMNGASDDLDSSMDFRQLITGSEAAPGFSFFTESSLIRKNYIENNFLNKSFILHTNFKNDGYYTIEAANIENFNSYRKVLLFDNLTNEFIDLKTELNYTFYSEISEGNRFTLILTNGEVEAESTIQSLTINAEGENGLIITQMGHMFNVVSSEDYTDNSQISLVNVLGQNVIFNQSMKFVSGSNIINVAEECVGVYILVIATGDKIVTKKVVL